MILGMQILGILFGLFMLYFTFLKFKRKEFKGIEFSFWIILWVLFIGIAIAPWILDPIVKGLDFHRRLDFFIIVGFLFLISLGVYAYSIAKKNQKRIEEIVREIAIKREK